MLGTTLAILAPAIVISTILWALDAAARQANPIRARMNPEIPARWVVIVRGALSRIS
jgi:hypothetical protein